MNTLTKAAPLGALGLTSGAHWVRFYVEGDSISFEVTASASCHDETTQLRKPTGFVQKWGGSVKRIEDKADVWLTHINEKHLH